MRTSPFHGRLAVAVGVLLLAGMAVCDARGKGPVPDLTKGGTKDDKPDWNLGPTGSSKSAMSSSA